MSEQTDRITARMRQLLHAYMVLAALFVATVATSAIVQQVWVTITAMTLFVVLVAVTAVQCRLAWRRSAIEVATLEAAIAHADQLATEAERAADETERP